MFSKSLKPWLFPDAAGGAAGLGSGGGSGGGAGGGGGSGEGKGAGDAAGDADTAADDEGVGDADADDEGDADEGKGREDKQSKKVKASKKVSISAAKLKEIQDKAAKADQYEREQLEQAEAKERDKLTKQQKDNPAAALTTLQKRYDSDKRKYEQTIATLTQENEQLRTSRDQGVKDAKIRESLEKIMESARVKPISAKAIPRMVKEISAVLIVEQQDDQYEIFHKDDGTEYTEVIKSMLTGEFKDLYVEAKVSDAANQGNARRGKAQGEGEDKRPSWKEAYQKRQDLYQQNGGVPSVGLKPKKS